MKPASAEERRAPTRALFASRCSQGRVFFGYISLPRGKESNPPNRGGTEDLRVSLCLAGEVRNQAIDAIVHHLCNRIYVLKKTLMRLSLFPLY